MVQQKSRAKVLISDKSHEDNLPTETKAAEIDLSNSVRVDAAENNILFQNEYGVQTTEDAEKEHKATLVGCNKVDTDEIDAAEEEYTYEEHAPEEVEMGLGEAKEGEEEKEEESDDYDDDNGDDADADDVDAGDDNGSDDDDDDDDDDDAWDDDDDDDDDDVLDDDEDADYDDEEDDVMDEEEIDEYAKLENNDNADSLRNTVEELKEEENAKEGNEKRAGGSLNRPLRTLSKGNKRKKVTTEVSDKEATKSKDKQEEDGQGDAMEEAAQGNVKECKEGSPKQKVNKLSKSSRRKVAAGGFEKVASKREVRGESSCRKKSSKKVKSMGMIFMCSSKTKKDCYRYKVLGLPENKRNVVGKIYKGMRLFLYDFDLKLMYGIYKAAGPGGYKIQPKAFNSQFPSQVRFTVLEDCLPLAEEKFKKVIKDNYFTRTKFDCQLTSQQVKKLCKLFVSASKGAKSKGLTRRLQTRAATDQDRSIARERQSAMDERHRYHKYSRKREREAVESPAAPVPRLLLPPPAATSSYAYDRKQLNLHEYSRKREREAVESPAAPVPQLLLPPSAAPPSYAYDRTLEMDAYRRDLSVEHLDSRRHPEPRDAYRAAPLSEYPDVYRRDALLDRLDSYRRDVLVEPRDWRMRDEIGRHDPYISYREYPEHHDLRSREDFGRHDPYFCYRGSPENRNLRSPGESLRRDPYFSYGERPAFRDHVYDRGPLPEHYHCRPVNRPSKYRSAVAPAPRPGYRSARARYWH